MERDPFDERILKQLDLSSNAGDVTNAMGTRLIGHAPDIAPKAFVHVVYAPLGEIALQEFGERLGRSIPPQFREFLTCANGLLIFSGAIRVMGYVPLKIQADTSIYNYPSNIMIPNVSARIRGLSHGTVVVGWYKADGSNVSIEEDGTAVRFDAKGNGAAIQAWPDFDSWLISEVSNLNSKIEFK
jgi:hypothetical protein